MHVRSYIKGFRTSKVYLNKVNIPNSCTKTNFRSVDPQTLDITNIVDYATHTSYRSLDWRFLLTKYPTPHFV